MFSNTTVCQYKLNVKYPQDMWAISTFKCIAIFKMTYKNDDVQKVKLKCVTIKYCCENSTI